MELTASTRPNFHAADVGEKSQFQVDWTTEMLTGLLLLAMPFLAGAHHATAIQFDVSRTIKLTGVVSKLDWANPHVHVSMDIKISDGVEHWDIELASPGGIVVSGLSRDLLKPGTTISIMGYPGKAGTMSVCAKELTLPDGRIASFVVGI